MWLGHWTFWFQHFGPAEVRFQKVNPDGSLEWWGCRFQISIQAISSYNHGIRALANQCGIWSTTISRCGFPRGGWAQSLWLCEVNRVGHIGNWKARVPSWWIRGIQGHIPTAKGLLRVSQSYDCKKRKDIVFSLLGKQSSIQCRCKFSMHPVLQGHVARHDATRYLQPSASDSCCATWQGDVPCQMTGCSTPVGR